MNAVAALYHGPHRRDFRFGTYLALLHTMAVGDLVQAIYGHTRLADETHARLTRTRRTLLDLILAGVDTPEGRAGIERLRAVHRGIAAPPDDYRYVLCLFVTEPLRWNAAHGRRPLDASQRRLLLDFWAAVGRGMGVDMPATLEDWQAFQHRYEAARLRHTPQGHRLASQALNEVVRLSLPRGTRALSRHVLLATMDPRVRETLALGAPRPWVHAVLRAVVRRV